MSLIKKEIICVDCDKQYILVIQPEDKHEILSCPFCGTPIAEDDEPVIEDQE